ncbi:MAG: cell division protein ZapA [Rickettsiales bacterium]|jgi:cell division protein ZapA|nr:cell division protein ZapA [Rickettsiales bacterium]
MSALSFSINGKTYSVEVPMGQEAYIRNLAVQVDAKAKNLASVFRGADQETLLLMCAIITAGEAEKTKLRAAEAEARAAAVESIEDELAAAIDAVAGKLESIAGNLA